MVKLLLDRNVIVSCRKEVRTDLALKFSKQELSGESGLGGAGQPIASPASGIGKKNLEETARRMSTAMDELVVSQNKGFAPIIIVPSVSNSKSRLTALNVVKFLTRGEYIEPNPRVMTRPDMPLEIGKSVLGRLFRFRIFDDVTRFKKDDWKSVVAVFTDGKMWQFSGWPFRNEADFFHTLLVVNLRYTDDPIEAGISGGRVRSLVVNRVARHQDSAVMVEFWKAVETFLSQPRIKKFSTSSKLP